MNFNEAFNNLKEQFKDKDVSNIDNIAFEFRVNDPEGIFYAEVKNGKLSIEPYNYYDNNCVFTAKYEVFRKIINLELSPISAYLTKKLRVEGDLGKAMILERIIKSETDGTVTIPLKRYLELLRIEQGR